MLTQILAEFERERRPLSSRELASTFDKDLDVVEGMLDTLVSSGRLVELVSNGPCDKCPAQGLCVVLPLEGRRFCSVSQGGWNLPEKKGTSRIARDRGRP